MKKEIKAVRVELPSELYYRFKKVAEINYTNPTNLVRNFIVEYVKEKENEEKNKNI